MKHKYCNAANGLELLAPAGSFSAFQAVIHAGADAVYLGGDRFGARAYADNFTKEELLEAIDYAHLHGRKVFLTVNTLLKQTEMEGLYDYLLPYYEQGLDAVIVQDFGVMQYVRTYFPKLSIHISTQMSVADVHGAAYLKSLGAARIVTARELSLEEIQKIHDQVDIEIESFVHGALCYCYSGQCLFSSMLGGRSGNRGRCAQPCRLPYAVLDADRHRLTWPECASCMDRHKLSRSECYPLSPKDLCTVEQIPVLAKAGIYSFKIEGRMKSAEYAAGVAAIYRKYIDEYLHNGTVSVQKQDIAHLSDAGNRSGFTDGYYNRRNGPEMITMTRPAYTKNTASFLEAIHEDYVARAQKIPVVAEVFLKISEPAMLTVSANGICGFAQYGVVQAAQKQPVNREQVIQQLSKTGNTPYIIEAIDVTMDDNIFVPKQILNKLRRDALENLTQLLLKPYRKAAVKAPHTTVTKKGQTFMPKQENIPFCALVENDRQLAEVLKYHFINRIYLDSSMYLRENFVSQLAKHITFIKTSGKQAYLVLPAVFRRKTAQFYKEQWQVIEQTGIDGYLVKSQDGLGFCNQQQVNKKRCVLDHSLYTWSNDTKLYYASAGWLYDTVPLELNQKELSARDNTASEFVIYGHMPLMTSAQCLLKTFRQCSSVQKLCYLKDRYAKEFPVKNNCAECYNTIYNAQALSLIQLPGELTRLHPAAYRLQFTIESAAKVRTILNCCQQSFFEHKIPDMEAVLGAYTNGHFKRGVE